MALSGVLLQALQPRLLANEDQTANEATPDAAHKPARNAANKAANEAGDKAANEDAVGAAGGGGTRFPDEQRAPLLGAHLALTHHHPHPAAAHALAAGRGGGGQVDGVNFSGGGTAEGGHGGKGGGGGEADQALALAIRCALNPLNYKPYTLCISLQSSPPYRSPESINPDPESLIPYSQTLDRKPLILNP